MADLRIEKIVAETAGLSGPERRAAIHRLCEGDREFEAAVLRVVALAERPTAAAGSESVPQALIATEELDRDRGSQPLARLAAPDSIGPYRILGVLGEGGFGVVYAAERREPHTQRVALKLIKAGMDTRQVLARFEQERQALAVMDHPNIARVFDAGATEQGQPYFVMEHVKGEPITDYCDRERLTLRQRLELFVPVCQAVQHAHHKGIIHRDLKPSNILVGVYDGKAVPKVIDFGVAKATAKSLTEKTIFTETGQLIGTPEYMSPEQAEMGATDIDTRTDVYSLGAVLYELLVGAVPFDSKSLRAAGLAEIQRIIREQDPAKPSTRLSSLAAEQTAEIARRRRVEREQLAGELRRELDWIPLKALRKSRTERYETPGKLAEDIESYLDGRPLEAGPESAGYRLRKFVRRNRIPVIAGALVALALIVGLVGLGIGLWRASTAEAEQRRLALNNASLAVSEAEQAQLAREREHEADAARERAEREAYISNIVACQGAVRSGDYLLAVSLLERTEERFQGLEYDLLARAVQGPWVRLRGHRHASRELAFSPDGRWLASSGMRGELCLWDLRTLELRAMLWNDGPGLRYTDAAFSHDSLRLVTAGDGEIVVFDLRDDSLTPERLSVPHQPRGVACSPDRDLIAYTADDLVGLVSLGDGSIASMPIEGQRVHRMDEVRFTPDGSRLIASEYRGFSTWGNLIVAWDVATRQVVGRHEYRGPGIVQLKASNDQVLVNSFGWPLTVFSLPQLEELGTCGGEAAPCGAFGFEEGEIIAGDDWCLRKGVLGAAEPPVYTLHGSARPYDIEKGPSGLLAVATLEGDVLLARVESVVGQRGSREFLQWRLPHTFHTTYTVEFTADGRTLIGGDHTGLSMWTLGAADGDASFDLSEPMRPGPDTFQQEALQARCSPDGALVAGIWPHGVVACWDLRTGSRRFEARLSDIFRAGALIFRGNHEVLVGKPDGEIVRLRVRETGTDSQPVIRLGAEVTDLALLDDGRCVASSAAGEIVVFDPDDPADARRHQPVDTPIHALAVHSERGLVAYDSGTGFGPVDIVVATLADPSRPLVVMSGHRRTIGDIEWVLDEQDRLVTISYDRTLRLWDLSSARQLLMLEIDWGWDISVGDHRIAYSGWGHPVRVLERSSLPRGFDAEQVGSASRLDKARARFDSLWDSSPGLDRVRAVLDRDPGLDDPTRQLASRLVEWYAQDPQVIHEDALALAVDPATPPERMRAMAARLAEISPRHSSFRGLDTASAEAFLAYRLGDEERAREMILRTRATQAAGIDTRPLLEEMRTPHVLDTLFLAMSEWSLGNLAKARELEAEASEAVERFEAGRDGATVEMVRRVHRELRAMIGDDA